VNGLCTAVLPGTPMTCERVAHPGDPAHWFDGVWPGNDKPFRAEWWDVLTDEQWDQWRVGRGVVVTPSCDDCGADYVDHHGEPWCPSCRVYLATRKALGRAEPRATLAAPDWCHWCERMTAQVGGECTRCGQRTH